MDTAAWMPMGGLTGLAVAMVAGFLFSFTPVAFASIPVILAYVTRARALREAISYGLSFAAGMIVTHVGLGVGAALGGGWAQQLLSRQLGMMVGPFLILLGLLWIGWLKLPLPGIPVRGQRAATRWGAFILGIPFTVGICPACSPGLWVGLGASAAAGSVVYGAALMLAFALGRCIPLVVGAISIGWLESLQVVERWRHAFEVVGGLVLISVGLYLMNEIFFWI